jgi:hypothetical protein
MKYVLVIMISVVLFSCSKPCKHTIPNSIVLVPTDTVEGRPVFTVIFEDEKTLELMYSEEIAHGLITGDWRPDEDLRIAPASEYQVILEPDSIMIYDWKRLVAAVPYKKAGVLDSVFMKDNE